MRNPKPTLILDDTCPANLPNTIATNDHSPAPDAGSFPKILSHNTGRLGGKLNNSINENCLNTAQSPENNPGPEYLPNTNYQIFKQKSSNDFSGEIANGNVATKFSDSPANVSYNTQGALNEPPLDVSNVMD
ncbi:hypothetical protein DSO57_1029499 [Entomophthora muscae]|uniref:Uncharacterized protein n=1 Tax=Entomophthora muscae TaxID=34485 RepID=A0ACC2ULL1_9FUNG|nr:hypothetical protein DSO57_1029499 [Entomophthora muscae]